MLKVDILLPCYNEEITIGKSIKKIKRVMSKQKYDYSIVVCDNNSDDNSRVIAEKEGGTVIIEKEKGYGATLLNGINNSKADYIVMLDSDLSYNEKDIPKMLKLLDQDYDFIIGNRFKGNIEKNAMPLFHRIGSRMLTEYANVLFRTPSHDYHCGLRAFKRKEIIKCNLVSKGFEFASEMIIKAKLNKLKIKEVSTDLFKDGRDRKSHLRTIRDGLRHLFIINKIKFQQSFVFKYISIFFMLIAFMLCTLFFSAMIPNKYIYDHTVESFDFFEKYFNTINSKKEPIIMLEGNGDVRAISIAYNMDSKKPLDSIIRMSYLKDIDQLYNISEIFINQQGENVNYSRYWHGQALYLKIILLLMPLGYTLYFIQFIILLILFILILKKMYKKNIILTISYAIMCISINVFFTAFSVQYYFSILLMFIFSYMILKLYENNKESIGIMFAINGALTCFFDFLTCETITLTIPLFIYIFLSIEDNTNNKLFKEIIKYILIWGLFYCFTFLAKWIIAVSYFGLDYIKILMGKGLKIVVDNEFPVMIKFIKTILLTFSNIIPFNFFENGSIIVIMIILLAIHMLIFEYKKYILLLLPPLIPFIRFLILSSHSYNLYFLTYRALGVLIIFVALIFNLRIKDIINKVKRIIDCSKKNMI